MVTTLEKGTALTGFTREAVEALSHAKSEPSWLLEWRLASWDVFESLPWPLRSDEEWRRTDLKGLKLDRLAPFAGVGEREVSADAVLAAVEGASAKEEERAGLIVQRDGSTGSRCRCRRRDGVGRC